MNRNPASEIKSYHAHLYYDAATKATAEAVRAALHERFPEVVVGRWHDRPVGPHPEWSTQVAFRPHLFGDLIPWLSLNAKALTVFIHPNTGDGYADHADHAMWVGPSRVLNLKALERLIQTGATIDDEDED